MLATWPMVFAALVAGLITGFLIPEVKQKPATSSVVAAKTVETTKTAAPKRALPTPAADGTSAPAKKDTPAGAPQKSAENEDCERQTWPYLTPNCLDRSAQAAKPDVVVKTKLTEPTLDVDGESKPAQAPVATAGTAPKADSKPKADTAPAAKNAAASPAPSEARPAEKSAEKQEPAQAAAPAPEKSARRPAARARPEARAEAQDEPLRPRGERYRDRGERRYAGRLYEDDRPVYIERGGRLYLAPEYQHRLRGPERYWREW